MSPRRKGALYLRVLLVLFGQCTHKHTHTHDDAHTCADKHTHVHTMVGLGLVAKEPREKGARIHKKTYTKSACTRIHSERESPSLT